MRRRNFLALLFSPIISRVFPEPKPLTFKPAYYEIHSLFGLLDRDIDQAMETIAHLMAEPLFEQRSSLVEED